MVKFCYLKVFAQSACLFRLPDEENGALHQHGSSAEGMAAAKTQAAEPAVDIGTAAHDKDIAGGPNAPSRIFSDVVLL